MNNPKFQIFRGTDNQFYFRLRATNGEIVINSEGYYSKQSCEKGVISVKINALIDARYDRRDATENYRFNLNAANGEIIGRSESYKTRQGRENGIEAVKIDAPGAPTEDLAG